MILRKYRHILLLFFLLQVAIVFSQEEIDSTVLQGDAIQMIDIVAPSTPSVVISLSNVEESEQSLNDFLVNQTGVYIKNYGAGQLATISSRGMSASQTDIVWNGLQLNSPMLGQTDLSLVPLQQTNFIYFSNSQQNISPQVNLVNNLYNGDGHELNIGSRYGSFTNIAPSISYSYSDYKFSSETSFRYSYGKNNFRYTNPSLPFSPQSELDNAQVEQFNLAHSMAFGIGGQFFKLHYIQSIAKREIPPTLFERISTERQDDKLYAIVLQYALDTKKNWHGNIQAGYNFQRNDFYPLLNANPSISKINSWQAKAEVKKRFGLYWLLEQEGLFNIETAKSANYEEDKMRTKGAYAIFLERTIHQNIYLRFGLAEQWMNKDFTRPLPSLSLKVYHYLNGNGSSFFKIQYAQHQRFPTFNDLYWTPGGNEDLYPEKSNNMEVVWRLSGSFGKHTFFAKTSMFHILADDYIQWQPTTQGYWSPINVGKVYSRGWEQTLDFDFLFEKKIEWNTTMKYTYTRTTNIKEDESYQLIYVPFHQWTWSNIWRTKIINGTVSQRVVGENFVVKDNTRSIDRFYLLDISLFRDFSFNKSTISIYFDIKNILNKEYQTVLNYPMMGRNFELKINYQFNK